MAPLVGGPGLGCMRQYERLTPFTSIWAMPVVRSCHRARFVTSLARRAARCTIGTSRFRRRTHGGEARRAPPTRGRRRCVGANEEGPSERRRRRRATGAAVRLLLVPAFVVLWVAYDDLAVAFRERRAVSWRHEPDDRNIRGQSIVDGDRRRVAVGVDHHEVR